MADDSEINILLNDLNSIMNNILAIDENPDNPNVTWRTIHEGITAAIEDMDEIGQQMDEDAILMQDVIDGMLFVAEAAENAEQDGNTNNVRLRLQDVIDAVEELPRVNENEGIGGYRKRKHRKHRTHRRRKHRTQRRRNRRRTHRSRK